MAAAPADDVHELDPSSYIDEAYGYSSAGSELLASQTTVATEDLEPSYPSYLYSSAKEIASSPQEPTQQASGEEEIGL
jgi:hypothetical protein